MDARLQTARENYLNLIQRQEQFELQHLQQVINALNQLIAIEYEIRTRGRQQGA